MFMFSNIAFQIYDTGLENVTDFSGFNDLLHSFELYRGKREDHADDITDQKRIVGTFKGGFKIYRFPLPHHIEQPDPQLGMFKVRLGDNFLQSNLKKFIKVLAEK